MEGFLHAVSSVTIILLLTATGYLCAERGWMGPCLRPHGRARGWKRFVRCWRRC